MMRIKEAIQRRKLIQQLNDEYEEYQSHLEPVHKPKLNGKKCPLSDDSSLGDGVDCVISDEEQRIANLRVFVKELNTRLTYPQRRALRVTWTRLSEAPKTSGRGNLQIMEKVFDRLIDQEHGTMSVFYRSAFIKCIEDRRHKRCGKSIATLRDHAHLLIDFIDGVLNIMFDQPLTKPVFDPVSIGQIHSKLGPLGFDRVLWLKLGECFAEVMFSQEVVRAYPHAAGAWSLLAVACTDKMYTSGKMKEITLRHSSTSLNLSLHRSSSMHSSSCRSLDQLEDFEMEDSSSSAPPNTHRDDDLSMQSGSVSNQTSPVPSTTSSSARPNSCASLDSQQKSPHQRLFEPSHASLDLYSQRTPRQLPYKSACGRYQAKKDAFRAETRLKSSSFSSSRID